MQLCNQRTTFLTLNLQFAYFVWSKMSVKGIIMFLGMNNTRLERKILIILDFENGFLPTYLPQCIHKYLKLLHYQKIKTVDNIHALCLNAKSRNLVFLSTRAIFEVTSIIFSFGRQSCATKSRLRGNLHLSCCLLVVLFCSQGG